MSGSLRAWYGLRDLESFAARQVVIDGEIALSEMRRLKDLLYDDGGSVRASLRFRQRGSGWPSLELDYRTTLRLKCQRCLEPFECEVADRVEMAVLNSSALERHLPDGCEPLVLEDERLLPAQLLEDELIVALPLAPKHARVGDCGGIVRGPGAVEGDGWILRTPAAGV